MSLRGCWGPGAERGRGRGGGTTLGLVSVVSDQGSSSSSCPPSTGQTVSGPRVCDWDGASV